MVNLLLSNTQKYCLVHYVQHFFRIEFPQIMAAGDDDGNRESGIPIQCLVNFYSPYLTDIVDNCEHRFWVLKNIADNYLKFAPKVAIFLF